MSLKVLVDRRFWRHALFGMMEEDFVPEFMFTMFGVPLICYLTAGLWSDALLSFLNGWWLMAVANLIPGLFFPVVMLLGVNYCLGRILCKLIWAAWMADDRKYFLDGMRFLEDDDSPSISMAHWTNSLTRLAFNRVFRGYYFLVWRNDFHVEYELYMALNNATAPEWVKRKRDLYKLVMRLEAL